MYFDNFLPLCIKTEINCTQTPPVAQVLQIPDCLFSPRDESSLQAAAAPGSCSPHTAQCQMMVSAAWADCAAPGLVPYTVR